MLSLKNASDFGAEWAYLCYGDGEFRLLVKRFEGTIRERKSKSCRELYSKHALEDEESDNRTEPEWQTLQFSEKQWEKTLSDLKEDVYGLG